MQFNRVKSMVNLSKRSHVYRKVPAFKELNSIVYADQYHEQHNPNGIISAGVANNILMGDVLTEQIKKIVTRYPATELDLDYTDNHGSPIFRSVTANLFKRYIFKVDADIDPEDIVVINGACAVVEQVVAAICDAGECVMIPSPLYHSFEVDICGRNECEIVPAPMTENMNLDFDGMDRVFEKSHQEGKIIKMFMLCHPNNPTGTVYTPSEVSRIIDWCRDKNIHFVSDEMYALSILENSSVEFVSAGRFMFGSRDVNHVHIIYGLSKDFMLNGFRVGMLYSQNKELLETMKATSAFHSISTHTQVVLTQLLGDDEFVSSFLQLSKERLSDCYSKVKGILRENNIEFYDPQAGQFFWINLAPLITKKLGKDKLTKEDELAVWRRLVKEARVFMFAGQFFKCVEVGWFRLCFTCRSVPTIELSVKRLVKWFHST